VGGLSFLRAELDGLEQRGLLRTRPAPGDALVLCSNDYLGFASEPFDHTSPASAEVPSGAGASRLVSGEHVAHATLEQALARWVGLEAALLFSSGYAANVGLIPALAEEPDVIVSDALNHASIIDACRLSRARVIVTPHLDVAAVEGALAMSASTRRRFVVTESYFSMDADAPSLGALRKVCDAHGAALIVDEAHALGVFGEGGRGRSWLERVVPDVLVGTLGKAVGLQGAFVAGSHELESWLWNRARSFVFSTGSGPALAAAAVARVERVITDDAGRARLDELAARLRSALLAMGAPLTPSTGPIVPIVVGDARRAVALRDLLLEAGVYVQAIRPPTVPEKTSRLRITLHAKLTDEELDRAIVALRRVFAER
jgi:8-amino-7-oxononanoate synthase